MDRQQHQPRPGAPAPAWTPVWSRLHILLLNRQHRLTAWGVFHGALWCGAFRAFLGRCRQQLSLEEASVQAAYPRPACQGQPEMLTHFFLTCPSERVVLLSLLRWLIAFLARPGLYLWRCHLLWVCHALILDCVISSKFWRPLLWSLRFVHNLYDLAMPCRGSDALLCAACRTLVDDLVFGQHVCGICITFFFFFFGGGRGFRLQQRRPRSRTMGTCRTTQHGARQYFVRGTARPNTVGRWNIQSVAGLVVRRNNKHTC